ncbi:MAG: hypothetical protein ACI36Y_09025 [Coriobacteriales bacterium]
MTQPPQPPLSLAQLTPDVTKAAYLERMLDNNAASYKHYWLRTIVPLYQIALNQGYAVWSV